MHIYRAWLCVAHGSCLQSLTSQFLFSLHSQVSLTISVRGRRRCGLATACARSSVTCSRVPCTHHHTITHITLSHIHRCIIIVFNIGNSAYTPTRTTGKHIHNHTHLKNTHIQHTQIIFRGISYHGQIKKTAQCVGVYNLRAIGNETFSPSHTRKGTYVHIY